MSEMFRKKRKQSFQLVHCLFCSRPFQFSSNEGFQDFESKVKLFCQAFNLTEDSLEDKVKVSPFCTPCLQLIGNIGDLLKGIQELEAKLVLQKETVRKLLSQEIIATPSPEEESVFTSFSPFELREQIRKRLSVAGGNKVNIGDEEPSQVLSLDEYGRGPRVPGETEESSKGMESVIAGVVMTDSIENIGQGLGATQFDLMESIDDSGQMSSDGEYKYIPGDERYEQHEQNEEEANRSEEEEEHFFHAPGEDPLKISDSSLIIKQEGFEESEGHPHPNEDLDYVPNYFSLPNPWQANHASQGRKRTKRKETVMETNKRNKTDNCELKTLKDLKKTIPCPHVDPEEGQCQRMFLTERHMSIHYKSMHQNPDPEAEESSQEEEDAQNRTHEARRRGAAKIYQKDRTFETFTDAEAFIKEGRVWRRAYTHNTFDGRKIAYHCNQGKRRPADQACPAALYVLLHREGPQVSLFRATNDHANHTDTSSRGIADNVKEKILALYKDGVKTPKQILHFLKSTCDGSSLPRLAQLRNFLTSARKTVFADGPWNRRPIQVGHTTVGIGSS